MSRSRDDVRHHFPNTLLGRWTTDPDQVASDLEAAGWPSVADDVREEDSDPDVILGRLHEIGEGDSDAADIIAWAAA